MKIHTFVEVLYFSLWAQTVFTEERCLQCESILEKKVIPGEGLGKKVLEKRGF